MKKKVAYNIFFVSLRSEKYKNIKIKNLLFYRTST